MTIRTQCLMLAGAVIAGAADYAAEGKRWWAHVEYLAADRLEGRNTGSKGERMAAQYVAREFERAGLKPAGTSGYFQPIRLAVRRIDESRSRLEFIRDGKPEAVKFGDEAILGSRGDPGGVIDAPAVFAGYGLSIPEARHDDLAGLDLRGKIAVFLSGGPKSIPGPLKAHHQSAGERWKAMLNAGAVGLAAIPNPKSMDIPWERSSLSRLQPSMSIADAAFDETRGLALSLTLNPARADRFLAGTGHTMAEILAAADADRPLPRFPLAGSFRARVAVERSRAESRNIAGLLPGADPGLRDECIVLSAHLDHVGAGRPIGGDRIYNGAMDDASGIASLIEIARLPSQESAAPRRSVLFLAVTGEEKGLLGSRYFAARPTINPAGIVADINMDMFLPLTPLRWLEVQGVDESTLGDDIRAAAREEGVQVQADKEPDRNRFIRSDQYSFIRRGIPALAFKFGYEKGAPEEKIYREWYRQRYHAPSDDLSQPVDLAAAARFNRVLLRLIERVANAPQRPQWKPESFFRRFAAR